MDDIHPLVRVGLLLATIALIVFFFVYRKEETIVIESRWWVSTTAVRYDETHLETECTPETVCNGYGDDRRCMTEMNCQLVSKTHTYTHCSIDTSGDTLPVVYPDVPCAMRSGDYIRHSSIFYIAYHRQEVDETRRSSFANRLWDLLEPRGVVKVKKNILGIIVDAEVKWNPA